MECARCRGEARYNRVILSRREGTVVGGLCRPCEVSRYGDDLRNAGVESGCLVCSGEPTVVLPEHKLELTAVAGETRSEEHYRVEPTTPRLCARHAPTGSASERDASGPVAPPGTRTSRNR